jgi:hypothetical protein
METRIDFSIEPKDGAFELTVKEANRIVLQVSCVDVETCMSELSDKYPQLGKLLITGVGYTTEEEVLIDKQYEPLDPLERHFILEGGRIAGNFTEGIEMSFERFPNNEMYERAKRFCEFLDNEIGGAGRNNIDVFHKYWGDKINMTESQLEDFDRRKNQVKMLNDRIPKANV